jgi:hypothetical protein
MKAIRLISISLLAAACGRHLEQDSSALDCSSGQTPIFSDRFSPQAGASGVANATDAEAGMTASPADAQPTSTGDQPSAMTVSCGSTSCGKGQVAVNIPAPAGPGSGPIGTGADPPIDGAPSGGGSTPPQATQVCAAPPPNCPTGQSPQFTLKQTWECTDCALVVTYGGTYGNYRRCVSTPTLQCSTGEVPTWVYENEDWECQPTCDNGQYDQRTIAGMMVCVPC